MAKVREYTPVNLWCISCESECLPETNVCTQGWVSNLSWSQIKELDAEGLFTPNKQQTDHLLENGPHSWVIQDWRKGKERQPYGN